MEKPARMRMWAGGREQSWCRLRDLGGKGHTSQKWESCCECPGGLSEIHNQVFCNKGKKNIPESPSQILLWVQWGVSLDMWLVWTLIEYRQSQMTKYIYSVVQHWFKKLILWKRTPRLLPSICELCSSAQLLIFLWWLFSIIINGDRWSLSFLSL